MVYA
jgi:hypothetical protein